MYTHQNTWPHGHTLKWPKMALYKRKFDLFWPHPECILTKKSDPRSRSRSWIGGQNMHYFWSNWVIWVTCLGQQTTLKYSENRANSTFECSNGIYPSNHHTFDKVYFFLTKRILFDTKTAWFTRENVKSPKMGFKSQILRFTIWGHFGGHFWDPTLSHF